MKGAAVISAGEELRDRELPDRNPDRRQVRRLAVAACLATALLFVGCLSGTNHVYGCEPGDGLTPICEFSNPEDLAVAPNPDWLLVSQFPRSLVEAGGQGSLIAYRPSDGERRPLYPAASPAAVGDPLETRGDPSCTAAPDEKGFAPHGIDVLGTTLFVVNHGGREAIEIFEVEEVEGGPSLRWNGCVELPEDATANDVVGLEDGRIVATKMMPRAAGPLTPLRIALGWNTGHVLVWSSDTGWDVWTGSEDSAPNGLEVSADGETLYYASWGRSAVVRVSRDGSSREEAPLDFHPDNLTWSSQGQLLAAGQGGPITAIASCGEVDEGSCGMPIGVASIDPDTLSVTKLIDHDPAEVGGAISVALEHQGKLWLGTFSGDRLVTWVGP